MQQAGLHRAIVGRGEHAFGLGELRVGLWELTQRRQLQGERHQRQC